MAQHYTAHHFSYRRQTPFTKSVLVKLDILLIYMCAETSTFLGQRVLD